MQFLRYTHDGSRPQWGVVDEGEVHALAELPAGEPAYADLASPGYRESVRRAVAAGSLSTVPEAEVRHLAPVPEPGKIVNVALNEPEHAAEQDEAVPERPVLFAKAPTAVANPGDPIVRPEGVEELDYEVELGIVVGRTARDVAREDAADYVAGYTAMNDVSARDIQYADEQFFRGKSFDTFAPMGPRLATGDDGFDPATARLVSQVNGEVRQDATMDDFVTGVYELVEFVSDAMTLRPGDVISTGTPGGVGIHMETPELLEPGDEVTVEVEGVGALTNPVVGP